MDATLMERKVVKAEDGSYLAIAPGTEKDVAYGEMLAFWEDFWRRTGSLRKDGSAVEEFLLEKRLDVERENRE